MGQLSDSIVGTGTPDETPSLQPTPAMPATPELAPPSNTSFDLGRSILGDPSDAAKISLGLEQGRTPDQAARILKLQQRTRLPVTFVAENADMIEQEVNKTDFDVEQFVRDNPKAAAWMAENPEHAALAKDDTQNMGTLERIITALGSGWTRQSKQSELGDILFQELEDKITPAQAARRDVLKEDMRRLGSQQRSMDAVPSGAADVGYSARQRGELLYEQTKGVVYGGVAGGLMASAIPGVGTAAGGTAGSIAGALTTTTAYSYRLEASFAFDELRDMRDTEGKPIDPELAKNAARVVGGINTIIETGSEVAIASLLIPGWKQMIGGLTGKAAKQAVMTQVKTALASPTTRGVMLSALGKMTGAAAVEGLEEFIQAMVGAGGREAAQAVSGQDFAPDSLAQDILGASMEAKSAFIGTFFTMGPLVAPGTYVEAKQAYRAQQQEEFFKALGDVSRETKMREHLPEKYQELVEKLTKDGPVENLYVPVEFYQTHWQNLNLDPAAVAQEMGIAEQYAEAVETGGRLEIPTAVYARRIAPTEHHTAFAPELAVSADAMNARESQERLEAIDKEAEQYRQKDEKIAASATRVREDILGQLKGLYPDDVAEKYAKIYEAGFTAMASSASRDPFSVYEPYSLRVKREVPDVLRKLGKVDNLDLLLDRMRSGESVTMEQARGESLLQFLRKQGGLQDQGGELSARDIKKVARGLVRKKGMTLDEAAKKAMEAGYIKAHDLTELMAAIDEELAGKARYVEGKMDAKAMETMTAMEELEQFLGSRGVDLKALDNATVKRILAGQQLMPEGQTMAQSLPDTIDIDGVQRPTKNSEGKPIAQTEEAVRNFWKWFGESKAVDKDGRPIVLYHSGSFNEEEGVVPRIGKGGFHLGTKAAAEMRVTGKFVDDFIRGLNIEQDGDRFHWTSADGDESFSHNEEGFKSDQAALDDAVKYAHEIADSTQDDTSTITAAYLSIQNPKRTPDKKESWVGAIRSAKKEKHDGLVYRNEFEDKGKDSYIAFKATQIKSINNTGAYGTDTGNILYQSGNWYYSQLSRAIASAKQNAMPAKQWAAWLKANHAKLGVKAAELQHVGIMEWLTAMNDEKLTKEQVQAFVDNNGVQVEEEVLGDTAQAITNADDALRYIAGLEDMTVDEVRDEYGYANDNDYIDLARTMAAQDDYAKRQYGTKFDGHQAIKGGTNYREVVLTVPTRSIQKLAYDKYGKSMNDLGPTEQNALREELRNEEFRSSHFDKPNIIGHGRISEFTDADGKRTMVIQEIQSDWAQKGRQEGFPSGEKEIGWDEAEYVEARRRSANALNAFNRAAGDDALQAQLRPYMEAARNAEREIENKNRRARGNIPVGPFVQDTKAWTAVVVKRLIRYAVDNGYERVAWTPGKAQVDLYTSALRAHVDHIVWEKTEEGVHIKGYKGTLPEERSGKSAVVNTTEKEDVLSDAIGKAMADKIRNDPAQNGVISGDDITIDSTGMATFYDRILPSVVKEVLKPLGGEKLITSKVDVPSTTKHFPKFNPLDENSDFLFEGAEDFENGDRPVEAESDFMIDGKPMRMRLIVDATGLHAISGDMEIEAAFPPDDALGIWSESSDGAIRALRRSWVDETYWGEAEVIRGEAKNIKPQTEYQAELQAFDITPTMREKVAEGMTLFQPNQDKKRGLIRFGADRKFEIGVLENADLSTFLHETGHFFLEVMGDLAEAQDANDQIKQDYQTLLKYFGVASRAQITVEHHEKFARSFEAYLREGKAPSAEMRSVFATFRAWLLGIYKAIKNLDVELNDDVRGVFDRMLATDEQIAAAEHEANVIPLFTTAEEMGKSQVEFDAYRKDAQDAAAEAREQLEQKLIKDFMRARKAWWKEERAKVEADVTKEVDDQDIYKTIAALQQPDGIRLDRKAIAAAHGKDFAKRLPKGVAVKDGGIHPDMAAEMLGYDSGEKMLMDMAGARNRNQLIQAETDRRMHEAHGDLLTDGSIHEEAKRAVQNELRGKVVEAEIRALNRKAKEVKPYVDAAKKDEREKAKAGQEIYRAIVPTQKQAKIQAERIIAGKRIREIRPLQYFAAAKNASKAALEAVRKGDYLMAGHQKSRELLSMELYRASLEAVDKIQKDVDKLKKTFRADTKQSATKNIDMVNAARAILAAHGIGSADKPPASYLESMRKYDPEMYENMRDRVDAAVADQKNYRDMTVEEFIGMRDAVLALVFTASRSKQIEVDGKLMDRKEVVAQLVARIQTFGVKEKAGYKQAMTKWEKTKAGLMSVRAYLRRVEPWVEAMDGGDPNGVFRRYVWNPMQDALNKYRDAKKDFLHRYLELVKTVEKDLGTGRIDAREIGYTFGKGTPTGKVELLHALLHTGNESNLSKLLRGRGWGEYREDGSLDASRWDAFIARMIRDGVLTKADYDFAQGVWDMLEELKPMAQKAHHQMYGFYFDEVTANPIDTPFGAYRGGYMPAVVDPNIVADAAIRRDRDELMHGQNSFAFPTTGRGFTMKRMEKYAKPLQLDMGIIPAHIDWVLRFVHLEPAGKDVGRVLINTDLREALDNIDPSAARHMLMPWIQRTVKQIVSHPGDLQWIDRMSRELRRRVGMQFMVANVINTLQQFTGLSIAFTKADGKNIRTAFWQYIRHPQDMADMIAERSVFMRHRIFTQHQEIMQHIDELLLNPTKYEKARAFADKHGYFLQQGTQSIVDKIAWTAAYNDALEQGMSDEGETSEAVRHADAVVRMTQGSFAPEDISRIEAGTPVARLFLMFYNYFNMVANLMGTEFANISTNKMGLKKGAGRALYIYIFAFMIPAFIGDGILRALVAGEPDEDDDGYMDDFLAMFFMTQVRAGAAMIPAAGPVFMAGINAWNRKWYDDRITVSPAVAAIESTVSAPHSVYKAIVDNGNQKKAVQDTLTAAGIITGFPVAPLGRPLGYLADINQGKAEAPNNVVDLARGLVSGRDPNREK